MQSQNGGALAQLVEQRTENPCVAGSIPAGTTYGVIEIQFHLPRFFAFYLSVCDFLINAVINILAGLRRFLKRCKSLLSYLIELF